MTLTSPIQAQRFEQARLSFTFTNADRRVLQQYAIDTWRSITALTCPSGLPADSIKLGPVRAQFTSPTNIGAYLWSVIAARDLRIITQTEAQEHIAQTLETLARMKRHPPSGMYYNWYDPRTGAKMTAWRPGGAAIHPFLSTVDNGWLAAALIVVSSGVPELCDPAQAILSQMDFGFFLNPNTGLLYGGCWPAERPPSGCDQDGYTCYDFGTLNTEPRIASYIGIAMGSLPPEHYFRMQRTFASFGQKNEGKAQAFTPEATVTRPYLGVSVFEGHYIYAGMQIVPSWGGSMFEALMPDIFVPEAQWGPRSWGINHPLYVQAQITYGLDEAKYGYWGFSPSTDPSGGYNAYGVEAIAMNPGGARAGGIVTPHASFLALPYAPRQALQNLEKLRNNFAIYSKWGFWDSVNVKTGQVSRCALSLDQGMIMAALLNALRSNRMQAYFSQGKVEKVIRPLLELEEFSAGQEISGVELLTLEAEWDTEKEGG